MTIRIADSAVVEPGASIGAGTVVWDLAQVRTGARVGEHCVLGRNIFVDAGVEIGARCKIQNNALLYAPARLADGVFVGPAAVLTNDRFPRAVTPTGELKTADDWSSLGVEVGVGASIGAAAIVIGGVRIGPWATVAAGAVVTRDVAAHSLVAGVPARHVTWVGRAGRPLVPDAEGHLRCPDTGDSYRETEGGLEERA